jgi:hypothetical protein
MEYFHISTSDNSCRGPPGLPRGPPETKFPLTTRRVLVCFLRARATSSLRHAILVCQTLTVPMTLPSCGLRGPSCFALRFVNFPKLAYCLAICKLSPFVYPLVCI